MSSPVFIIETTPLVVTAVDPLVDHRDEVWRYDLLDNTDAVVGQLEGVEEGGTLEFSVHNTIRSSGSLPITGPEVVDIDWDAHRIAPWYSLDGGATWEPWGIYLPTTPEVEWVDGEPSATIDLFDKLAIPSRNKVAASYAVDAGDNPIAEALTVLGLSGTHRVVAEPTTETLSVPMVWDPQTTHLRMDNDLLRAANYFSLWVDHDGAFRLDPYVRPQDRGTAFTFRSGVSSIHEGRIRRRQDTFDIPNRVTLTGPSDGETPALTSAPATDEDPNSPYSYVNRGYWVDYTETVEATSQSVLDALAARRLIELQSPSASLTIRHAPLPLSRLPLNSVVRLVDRPSGIDKRGVLQSFTVTMATGALVESKLVEVGW